MDFREQIRQMERVNINDMERVPEWARAEQLERIVPLKELWGYPKISADTGQRSKIKGMKSKKKKNTAVRRIVVICILAALVLIGAVFSHFGGFGTGESADPEEFAAYAGQISEITIPENTRIIALGEATHGNREFQQLKLDVFRIMVEQYGIRAFALEGDYGGCEVVNRYIHGGEGTAKEAAAAIGFAIYRTGEMEELISWMRSYNETAADGDDIRFYGFDMQRTEYSYQFLLEGLKSLGHDAEELEKLRDGGDWSALYDREERILVFTELRQDLSERVSASDTDQAIETAVHLTDILLQNQAMEKAYEENFADANGIRDQYMADNTMWILEQEERRGNDRIFITGHSGHMEQSGTYVGGENKVMGNLLTDRIGRDAYFAIGTDFYKTTCNFPTGSGKRVNRTFYSRDPLAKASRKNGYDFSWLDFSTIPADSSLAEMVNGYIFMGSLGDNPMDGLNGIVFRILPYAYRVWQVPSELYDGMIFVTEAHPISVNN